MASAARVADFIERTGGRRGASRGAGTLGRRRLTGRGAPGRGLQQSIVALSVVEDRYYIVKSSTLYYYTDLSSKISLAPRRLAVCKVYYSILEDFDELHWSPQVKSYLGDTS
jgi:hypothetical protein